MRALLNARRLRPPSMGEMKYRQPMTSQCERDTPSQGGSPISFLACEWGPLRSSSGGAPPAARGCQHSLSAPDRRPQSSKPRVVFTYRERVRDRARGPSLSDRVRRVRHRVRAQPSTPRNAGLERVRDRVRPCSQSYSLYRVRGYPLFNRGYPNTLCGEGPYRSSNTLRNSTERGRGEVGGAPGRRCLTQQGASSPCPGVALTTVT